MNPSERKVIELIKQIRNLTNADFQRLCEILKLIPEPPDATADVGAKPKPKPPTLSTNAMVSTPDDDEYDRF